MSFLSEIQQQLKAPKSQMNKFGGYKYRSCEDILEAVKPLLNGAVITLSDTVELIGDRFYIKATATISKGDAAYTTTAYAREAESKKGMDDSQVSGACSSYARKYALNGLLCIDDQKDSDYTNQSRPTAAQKRKRSKELIAENNDPVAKAAPKQPPTEEIEEPTDDQKAQINQIYEHPDLPKNLKKGIEKRLKQGINKQRAMVIIDECNKAIKQVQDERAAEINDQIDQDMFDRIAAEELSSNAK